MEYPAYDEYKDTEVEWLGTVPLHWDVDRFKLSAASCRNGIWGSEARGDENDIKCVRVADFDRERLTVVDDIPTIRNVTESERSNRTLSRGNLLLEKSGGGDLQPVGFVVLHDSDELAVCSNFVAKIELAEGMHPSYWRYCHSAAYAVRLNYKSIKQTSGIQNLDQSQYLNERAPFPPFDEQKVIASFLDAETSKIDALVAEQQHLIALLKEKRQAVISHAVSKGLNPDAPMKPSGIEWLGDVPAHWELKPLKYIGQIISGFAFKSHAFTNAGVRVLKIANIQTFNLDWSDESFVPVTFYENHQGFAVLDGDIVFALTRPIISTGLKAAIADIGDELVLLNQRNAIFRPTNKLDKHFIYHVLFSDSFRIDFENKINFTGQQPNISPLDIADIKIPLPPTDEQERLGVYLDSAVEKYSQLQAQAERAINLLQERRTALISDAVTGKIDVSNYVTQEAT